MAELNHHKIDEAILFAENDYPLVLHLDFDFYNTLVRKRMNGTYDKTKALVLVSKYFVPRIVKRYKKQCDCDEISRMTTQEKEEVGDYFLNRLWENGGTTLDRKPLKNVRKGDKVKILSPLDLDDYKNHERVKAY
ncbi:MAG: hypothetical protein M0R51_09210 [Clostridia bacterium]|jgi:hypothetical protein|nr:hypothetical protein [Clostridia bacterium]